MLRSCTLGCTTLSLFAAALLPHKEVFLCSCPLGCFAGPGVICPRSEAGLAADGTFCKEAAGGAAREAVGEIAEEIAEEVAEEAAANIGFWRTVKALLAAGAAALAKAGPSKVSSLMLATLSG